MFRTYFPIGFSHIVSLSGFDHVLFVLVLCAVYARRDWRRMLAVLTGFTVGHSLTLALTASGILAFPPRVVEILIPATILATGLFNVAYPHTPRHTGRQALLAAVFGLIHGCGFAGYFAMMLGEEQSITGPLLAFNIGLEAGQVVVVAAFYALYYLMEKIFSLRPRDWTLFVSGAGAGVAIKMILDGLFTI